MLCSPGRRAHTTVTLRKLARNSNLDNGLARLYAFAPRRRTLAHW